MIHGRQRLYRLAFLLPLVLLLAQAKGAVAALQEKEVLDDINDNIAVLRYLHRQIAEIEENLRLVRASRDLTQRQLDAQTRLYESEQAKGQEERVKLLKVKLDRLKRHMTKLDEFHFEGIYGARIKTLKDLITRMSLDLSVRMDEYEALFGKKPYVELRFQEEIERRRGARREAGHFLNLD